MKNFGKRTARLGIAASVCMLLTGQMYASTSLTEKTFNERKQLQAIQERTIGGKIMNADGTESLIGVSVKIKGGTEGTSTDEQGNFKLAIGALNFWEKEGGVPI